MENTTEDKQTYSFTFTFTETVTGQAYAKDEETLRNGLLEDFKELTDFKILEVTLIGNEVDQSVKVLN